MSATKLKEQARHHEQKEEWERAIELYRRVLENEEVGSGETELPIFNRIGDLYLRLGRSEEAVGYYEDAAGRYADAGLFNNAIALCNKALRYAAGRPTLLHRLGRYCAAQGFLTDARRWFLEYAEGEFKAGRVDDGFEALEEFAETTEDADIREMLGERLAAYDRNDEAVEQLLRAYALRVHGGEAERATTLRSRILEMDPDADLNAALLEPSGPQGSAEAEGFAGSVWDVESEAVEEETAVPPNRWPALDFDVLPDALQADPATAAAGEEEQAPAPAEAVEDPYAYGTVEPETIDVDEDEPELAATAESDPGQPSQAEVAEAADTEAAVEEPVSEELGLAGELARIDDLLMQGDEGEAVAELERLHDELAAAGRLDDAATAVDQLVGLRPDDPAAHQKRVEIAVRLGDERRLIEAYLGLGDHLSRGGATAKARAVYEQVLERDPGNERAVDALAAAEAEAVDVAGLVDAQLGGQGDAAEDPATSVEGPADEFAEILTEFKSKVSTSMPADDPRAHYDLGLAYKEMELLDEAIDELEIALQAGEDPLRVYEELGQCYMLKGDYANALKVLNRASSVPDRDPVERVGVFYHLGRCYEELGDVGAAKRAYEAVMGADTHFRDVAERLAAL